MTHDPSSCNAAPIPPRQDLAEGDRHADGRPGPSQHAPTPTTHAALSSSYASTKAPSSSSSAKTLSKRDHLLNELLNTEVTYNLDLDIINNTWMKRIERAAVISEADFDVIFSPKTFTGIRALNKALLHDLAGVDSLPLEEQDVGKRFQGLTASFLLYTPYCANQTASIAKIKALEKSNSKFAVLIEEIRQEPECSRLDLPSFLIKPMQRITKYPLLIKGLVAETPLDHHDHSTLVECMSKLESIVSEINSKKEKSENLEKLVELQNRFSDDVKLVSPTRRLLSQHSFKRIRVGSKSHKKALLFLFNDSVLVATSAKIGKKFAVRSEIIDIKTCWVWDLGAGEGPGFSLVPRDGEKVTCFVETREENVQWMDRMNKLIAGDHIQLRGKQDDVVKFERGGS